MKGVQWLVKQAAPWVNSKATLTQLGIALWDGAAKHQGYKWR
jgi:hypothetical protein